MRARARVGVPSFQQDFEPEFVGKKPKAAHWQVHSDERCFDAYAEYAHKNLSRFKWPSRQ